MNLSLILLIGGFSAAGAIVLMRRWEAQIWRRRLKAYQLTLPRDVTADQLSNLFSGIAAVTHRANWSLLPLPPVVIETIATAKGIDHLLLVSRANQAAVLSTLQANLPGLRFRAVEDYRRPNTIHALELIMTNRHRRLAVDRAEATASTLLTNLQPIPSGSALVVQVMFTSAGTPPRVTPPQRKQSKTRRSLSSNSDADDSEAVSQLRRKYEAPLLHATLRVGAAGSNRATTQKLVGRTWSSFQTLNAPGVRLVRRYLPSRLVASRLHGLKLPLLRWPLLANSDELVGMSGLPVGSLVISGLKRGAARQLPAPYTLPRRGLVLAHSNYPGQADRPLALATLERLRHSYIVGPTGSGKSWLLANCILQDISAGHGTFVIDVKGDLVGDVLARVQPEYEHRLVVIDPTNRHRPVGLNVLQHAGTEASRELAVDNVLHIFRDIWHGFWGPRTDWVMRAGLSTLTLASDRAGQQYTLVELSPLLTNPAFRRDLLARTNLPPDLAQFWHRFNSMSESERTQVIGPSLNKLDAFTSRTAIRLMLGQSTGVDLTDIFTRRSAVLLSLDKGQLGSETTSLLGALSVATLWQATLTRAGVPANRRRPAFAVIDEAQDIVRLPLAIADMLAQARGYGLGITLANQYVAQLPESVRKAILGTVRTQIAFALDYDDARLLERRFNPLSTDDLQGLQTYEVAIRPSVGGQTLMPVTGVTLPLPKATADPLLVAGRAANRYGVPRAEVERAMEARLDLDHQRTDGFGRERRGDAS